MSDPRFYVVGLPVVLYVHDDGTVRYEVDISEAADGMTEHLSDGLLTTDPAIVAADVVAVQNDIDARNGVFR